MAFHEYGHIDDGDNGKYNTQDEDTPFFSFAVYHDTDSKSDEKDITQEENTPFYQVSILLNQKKLTMSI